MSSTATAAPARSGRTGRSDQSARPGRTLSRRFWDRWADPLYTLFVVLLLGGAVVAIIYPLYFIVIASISDPNQVYEGNVWLWPRGVTLEGYARIFSTSTVLREIGRAHV